MTMLVTTTSENNMRSGKMTCDRSGTSYFFIVLKLRTARGVQVHGYPWTLLELPRDLARVGWEERMTTCHTVI